MLLSRFSVRIRSGQLERQLAEIDELVAREVEVRERRRRAHPAAAARVERGQPVVRELDQLTLGSAHSDGIVGELALRRRAAARRARRCRCRRGGRADERLDRRDAERIVSDADLFDGEQQGAAAAPACCACRRRRAARASGSEDAGAAAAAEGRQPVAADAQRRDAGVRCPPGRVGAGSSQSCSSSCSRGGRGRARSRRGRGRPTPPRAPPPASDASSVAGASPPPPPPPSFSSSR